MPLNCDIRSEYWLEDLPRMIHDLANLLGDANAVAMGLIGKRFVSFGEALIEASTKPDATPPL